MSATSDNQADESSNKNPGCTGKSCLLVIIAGLILIGGCHAYFEWQKHVAMQFCESLIPQIESAKSGHSYPTTLDPEWIKGKQIPNLIRVKHFYKGQDDTYVLYFWNPGDFMDDFWCYSSRDRKWSNYDANKPEDD